MYLVLLIIYESNVISIKMTLLTKSQEIETLCNNIKNEPFICLDTEFIREKYYYPKLCLIQIGDSKGNGWAIDPLSNKINLNPIFELLLDKKILKVLHSPRQDFEIIFNILKKIPNPIFDTQSAAMCCGFGDSASYESLVKNICNINLDSGTNDFPPSNIEVVNISSSDGASNVVPQIATGQLNVRYNINHNEESLKKIFDKVVKEEIGDSEYDFKIEHNNSAEPFLTEKGEFINIIKESVDEVTGLDAALTTTGGTSDARFFKDYCEVAEFGLIGETAHQVDENVKIADIENLEKIYYSILKKYFHKN